VCCSVLQCVAVCCSVLRCDACVAHISCYCTSVVQYTCDRYGLFIHFTCFIRVCNLLLQHTVPPCNRWFWRISMSLLARTRPCCHAISSTSSWTPGLYLTRRLRRRSIAVCCSVVVALQQVRGCLTNPADIYGCNCGSTNTCNWLYI